MRRLIEPSHLDLCCLQQPIIIACGSERVKWKQYTFRGRQLFQNCFASLLKRSLKGKNLLPLDFTLNGKNLGSHSSSVIFTRTTTFVIFNLLSDLPPSEIGLTRMKFILFFLFLFFFVCVIFKSFHTKCQAVFSRHIIYKKECRPLQLW